MLLSALLVSSTSIFISLVWNPITLISIDVGNSKYLLVGITREICTIGLQLKEEMISHVDIATASIYQRRNQALVRCGRNRYLSRYLVGLRYLTYTNDTVPRIGYVRVNFNTAELFPAVRCSLDHSRIFICARSAAPAARKIIVSN